MSTSPAAADRQAFTRERVAQLAGVPLSRIDYWDRTDLLRASARQRMSPGRETRLYAFQDLLDVLIIAELERRGVSKRHIREIVSHVRARDYVMSELQWAVAGSRVHFNGPDGRREDGDRSQYVMAEVLKLEPIRRKARTATDRDPDTFGQISNRRGTLGNKPVVAGTRVPIATIRRYLKRGYSEGQIVEAFPNLTTTDVRAVQQLAS
ncbi:MAG: DUF433 domain-containing protein [Micropruina sp.]|nr:DUF433 domain-containing protein [Micropruina sp.]